MKRASINRLYVPKFYGNRDLDEEEQVIVEMNIATLKERDQYSELIMRKGGKYEQKKKEFTALKQKIISIKNYYDDKDQPIDTAEKLIADLNAGSLESNELALELWNRLMGYGQSNDDEKEDDEIEPEELTEGED